MPKTPTSLNAKFAEDQTTIKKPKAVTPKERRQALIVCLDEVWPGVDIDTLERIDDKTKKLFGWAMWPR